MARYSLEISDLMNDELFELFDFNYDFYTDDMNVILNFEKKFINHYYFSEIGTETVYRFKRMLKSRLDMKMPLWKQLYMTEMKAKDIEFLLNKDYRETFTKDIERENLATGNESNSGTTSTKNDTNSNNTNTAKVSNLDNGVADVGLSQGKLTGMSEDKSNGSVNGTGSSTANNTKDSTLRNEGNEKESYTLEGKGNIGSTSSAELLEKWRSVLLNIDEIIIEDCHDLFMAIY